jgi:pimeloyl-ACP methyl ester carboxylesterase
VRGVGVHWVELGSADDGAVPMVLLHGLCDSHRTWRKVAPLLARGRRVLMPDLPGHGMSDRPDASYEVEWYAELIGAWIEALGLTEIDLVGHSFGGGVAQALLPTHASRVRHLALVSAGGLGREVNIGLRLWSTTGLAERVAQPFLSRGTRIGRGALVRGIEPDEIDLLSWMNGMPGSARSLSRTVRGVIGWRGQKQQFLDRVHEIERLPALGVFWGEKDNVVPAHHANALTATHAVAITRFRNVGHFPQLECPDELAHALDAFARTPVLAAEAARLPAALVAVAPSPAVSMAPARSVAATSRPAAMWLALVAWVLWWKRYALMMLRRVMRRAAMSAQRAVRSPILPSARK